LAEFHMMHLSINGSACFLLHAALNIISYAINY